MIIFLTMFVTTQDSNHTSQSVAELLSASQLSYTHLAASRPPELIGKIIGRGVFNR